MKAIISWLVLVLLMLMFCTSVMAKQNHHSNKSKRSKHHVFKLKKDEVEVEAINSPVKESDAKFKVTVPKGMVLETAKYQIFEKAKKKRKRKMPKSLDAILTKLDDLHYEIKFNVDQLPPGEHSVKLTLKDKKGKHCKVWFRRNQVEFVKFEIDPSLEVADPGEAGKETLLGIDSDNDGLRDDMQRWLNSEYSDDPVIKDVMKKGYRHISTIFKEEPNSQIFKDSYKKILDFANCLSGVYSSKVSGDEKYNASARALSEYKKTKVSFYNTKERIKKELSLRKYAPKSGVKNIESIEKIEQKELARCNEL